MMSHSPMDEEKLNDLDHALRENRNNPEVLAIWAAEHGPALIAALREAWRTMREIGEELRAEAERLNE